jgi:predicted nucleic acid-binding protein
MLLVVDANILVAELLRERGRALVDQPVLQLQITPKAHDETLHEIERRLAVRRTRADQPEALLTRVSEVARQIVAERIAIVPVDVFLRWEDEARERLPHDADDWPTVALALEVEAAIWTADRHFFGCGIAIWTSETLQARLRRYGEDS